MAHKYERGFSVREASWHGLATVLAEYPGREEAKKAAGHDFTVVERSVFAYDPSKGEGLGAYSGVPGWKALSRSDNGAIIACQPQGYQVVQNDTIWDIVDALVGMPNVKYETAGVLDGGAILWVLAWLNEPTVISGDDSATYPFVMVSTSHDSSGACKASAINVRVICWNTWTAAEQQSKSSGLEYVFRHTKNVHNRIADAKAAISGVRAANTEFLALANELAGMPVTPKGIAHFVESFIPEPVEVICTDRVRNNIREARQKVYSLLNGVTIADAHREKALGLVNVGIEYLDHCRAYRSADSYFRRSMMNTEAQKRALVRLARDAAAV